MRNGAKCYLQQSSCRVSLQALPQFVHLIQEKYWVIDTNCLQTIDDAPGHAPHICASGKEGGGCWWGVTTTTKKTISKRLKINTKGLSTDESLVSSYTVVKLIYIYFIVRHLFHQTILNLGGVVSQGKKIIHFKLPLYVTL